MNFEPDMANFFASDANRKRLFIVTPVYEDTIASAALFLELAKALGDRIFVVAVDDGSVNFPLTTGGLSEAGIEGIVLRLKRNVGHQKAIAIGISFVAEHCPEAPLTLVMDSDGEDVPSTIVDLIRTADSPDIDIAVAQRRNRVETPRFKIFYVLYKILFKMLSGRTINFGNFMVLKPVALRRLSCMQELWVHVAGCVLQSKLRVAICPLDRGPRYAGKSKMNFVGLALHGFRALMVFAEDVLIRTGIMCALVSVLAFLGGIGATVIKIYGVASPGWFSMALGILAVVFLQSVVLGLVTLMILVLPGTVRGGLVKSNAYLEYVESFYVSKG